MIIEDIIDTFYMFYNTKTVLVIALAPHTHRTDKKLDMALTLFSPHGVPSAGAPPLHEHEPPSVQYKGPQV